MPPICMGVSLLHKVASLKYVAIIVYPTESAEGVDNLR